MAELRPAQSQLVNFSLHFNIIYLLSLDPSPNVTIQQTPYPTFDRKFILKQFLFDMKGSLLRLIDVRLDSDFIIC